MNTALAPKPSPTAHHKHTPLTTLVATVSTPLLEFEALGTHWWIEPLGTVLSPQDTSYLQCMANTFERKYTRFSDTSQLGLLNADKQLKRPSAEFRQMIDFARRMHYASDGVFNISVGGRLAALGYGRQTSGNVMHRLWNEVVITPEKITIPASVSLDFGGFGKGWLLDTLGAHLQRLGHPCYIINGGGDILVSANKQVELALEHPYDTSLCIGTARIQNGALAASSTVKRSWKNAKGLQHHIINPKTGRPTKSAAPIASYVIAPTALIADTCATIILADESLTKQLQNTFDIQTRIMHVADFAGSF